MRPLDLGAIEALAKSANDDGGDYLGLPDQTLALLAALRAMKGALELARPFVLQYGAAYEVQQIEAGLDGVSDEP